MIEEKATIKWEKKEKDNIWSEKLYPHGPERTMLFEKNVEPLAKSVERLCG